MSDIAQMLEGQLEAKGLQARTLTLKLKQDNFRKHERTWTLPQYFGHRSSLSLEAIVAQRLEEQLRANRQALVTALDLHKTIRGAMGLPSPSLPFARDVLREAVSPMRSCREARVPPPLCDGFWQDFI